MAIIIRDSFDFYASSADAGANFWDTFSTGVTIQSANTRMGQGQAMQLAGSNPDTACSKNFTNQSTVFCCFAMKPTSLGADNYCVNLIYSDLTTVQVSVCFKDSGAIEVWQGPYPDLAGGGTLLQTFLYAYAPNIWTHWQIMVVFNGTTGEVHIRKDGNTVDDFAVTGVNTIKSANAYANKFQFNWGRFGGNPTRYVDDLAVWDGSGSGAWTTWVGDVRAVQVMPSADTAQKDFTSTPSTGLFGTNATGGTHGTNNGQQEFIPYVAVVGGLMATTATMNVRSTNGSSGNYVIGLYDSDGPGGQPGTLLTQATATNTLTSGDNIFTLGAAIDVVAGHVYYWSILTDTNSTQLEEQNSGPGFTWYHYNPGYSGTLAGDVSGFTMTTSNERQPTIHADVVTSNAGVVSELIQNGAVSFVSDDTVGDFDLYTNQGLTVTPQAIIGVSVRAIVAKSDAGARTGAITIKSGATSVDSSGLVLSTSFLNLVMYQDTDPDTGVAWTESGLNSAELGPKVAA